MEVEGGVLEEVYGGDLVGGRRWVRWVSRFRNERWNAMVGDVREEEDGG